MSELENAYERIGFGKYQVLVILIVGMAQANDGAQLIATSLQNPVLQKEWQLSSVEISLLTSLFYLGMGIGAITGGKFGEKMGRVFFLKIGSLLQVLFASLFFFISTPIQLMIVRALYGIGCGISLSLTTSIAAQVCPLKYRGKAILTVSFLLSLGRIYAIFLAVLFLQNFSTGNWRAMMALTCVPSIFVFIGAIIFLKETPRYLLAHQRFEEAFIQLNEMGFMNQQEQFHIQQTEKDQIREWAMRSFLLEDRAQIGSIFKPPYLLITICLSICWFSVLFFQLGINISLPYVFGEEQKSIVSLLVSVAGQIPCYLVNMVTIDWEMAGRRYTLFFFTLVSIVMNFLMAFMSQEWITFWMRFGAKGSIQIIYPITTESYGSHNRAIGFGFNSMVGRIAGIIMPLVVIPLAQQNQTVLFLLFSSLALITMISGLFIPETMGVALDIGNQGQELTSERDP